MVSSPLDVLPVCLYIIIEGENIVKELPPSVKSEHLVDSSSGHAPYPLDNFDPPKAERVNIKFLFKKEKF